MSNRYEAATNDRSTIYLFALFVRSFVTLFVRASSSIVYSFIYIFLPFIIAPIPSRVRLSIYLPFSSVTHRLKIRLVSERRLTLCLYRLLIIDYRKYRSGVRRRGKLLLPVPRAIISVAPITPTPPSSNERRGRTSQKPFECTPNNKVLPNDSTHAEHFANIYHSLISHRPLLIDQSSVFTGYRLGPTCVTKVSKTSDPGPLNIG